MIEIHPFHESHYPMLERWWKAHGWPAMPLHKLPPFGFIAWECFEGEPSAPLCASFAYLDNGGTGVAMIEWTVANPAAEGRSLIKSLRTLFDFMIQELGSLEYDVIFTSCRVEGLIKLYEKCGFTKTDEGMTHLVHITPSE